MIELSINNLEKLYEIANPYDTLQSYYFEKVIRDGFEVDEFVTSEGKRLTTIPKVAKELKVPTLYVDNILWTNGIKEAILFKTSSNLFLIYEIEYNGVKRFLLTDKVFYTEAKRTIFLKKEEAERYLKSVALKNLKKSLEETKDFLENPWREYEVKKKKYEQKLKKVEEATKRQIKLKEAEVEVLEKQIKEAESKLFEELGIK